MPPYQPYRPPPSSSPPTQLPPLHDPSCHPAHSQASRRPLAPLSSWSINAAADTRAHNESFHSKSLTVLQTSPRHSKLISSTPFETPRAASTMMYGQRTAPPPTPEYAYRATPASVSLKTPHRDSSSPHTIITTPSLPYTPSPAALHSGQGKKRKSDTINDIHLPSLPPIDHNLFARTEYHNPELYNLMPPADYPSCVPKAFFHQGPAPYRHRETRTQGHSANPWDYIEKPNHRTQFAAEMLTIMQLIYAFIDRSPRPVERERLGAWFGKQTVPVDTWFQNARQTEKNNYKPGARTPSTGSQPPLFNLNPTPEPYDLERIRVAEAICRGKITHASFAALRLRRSESGTLDSLLNARAIPRHPRRKGPAEEGEHGLLASLTESSSSSPPPMSPDSSPPPPKRKAIASMHDTPCRSHARFDARASQQDLFALSRRARGLADLSRSVSASSILSSSSSRTIQPPPLDIRYESSFCRHDSLLYKRSKLECGESSYMGKLRQRYEDSPKRGDLDLPKRLSDERTSRSSEGHDLIEDPSFALLHSSPNSGIPSDRTRTTSSSSKSSTQDIALTPEDEAVASLLVSLARSSQ